MNINIENKVPVMSKAVVFLILLFTSFSALSTAFKVTSNDQTQLVSMVVPPMEGFSLIVACVADERNSGDWMCDTLTWRSSGAESNETLAISENYRFHVVGLLNSKIGVEYSAVLGYEPFIPSTPSIQNPVISGICFAEFNRGIALTKLESESCKFWYFEE